MVARTGGQVLLVDDDEDFLAVLAVGLDRRGFGVVTARSAENALRLMSERAFDAVVTDLELGASNGVELCRVVAQRTEVPVLLISGHKDFSAAVDALRAGAYDYLTKPVQLDALTLALKRSVEHHRLVREVESLRERRDPSPSAILGDSKAVQDLRALVARVAPTDISVLVTGESGTGKELVARELARLGGREDAPFVAVNCAALPEPLLESELFGSKRGAYTDAKEDREGLFLRADGGVLFLDEIGEMPLSMQAKLLRALQEKKVRPVGGSEERSFSCRIVAATNRDLAAQVAAGQFREDLYYRINVVEIAVPPLRERGNDVVLLAHHFVDKIAERLNRGRLGLTAATNRRLIEYSWPGNVRELQNTIERAGALARGEEIRVDDLPDSLRSAPAEASTAPSSPASAQADDEGSFPTMLDIEKAHLLRALEVTRGNRTRAAQILGMDRRTMYRRLHRFGIGAKHKKKA